jgi:hypothetical protein
MTHIPMLSSRTRARLASQAQHTAEKLYANGYVALGDGNSELAMRSFMLMTGVAPYDARAWVGLGASLEQQGKWKRALGIYTFGRSLVPASVYCKLGEARVLARLGQSMQAQRVLDCAEVHANHAYELGLIERLRGEL